MLYLMSSTRPLRIAPLRAALFIGICVSANGVAQGPTFIPFDIPGAADTFPSGFNAGGDIVGTYIDARTGKQPGFLLSEGSVILVGDANGNFGSGALNQVRGISTQGAIVGTYIISPPVTYDGFRIKSGSVATITVPGSDFTECLGVSPGGDIVGDYAMPGSRTTHGFLLTQNRFITIDPPGATTVPSGINSKGDIVGVTGPNASQSHGFLLSQGVFTTIAYPSATYTQPVGINSKRQVVGWYTSGNPAQQHGFLYSDGAFTSIDFPGAQQTQVFGINEQSVILGMYWDSSAWHGFLRGPIGGSPVSDNFDSPSLNTNLWTKLAPAGGSVTQSSGHVSLDVPGGSAHDAWAPVNNSVRLMQNVANLDFDLIAKFDSFPASNIQMQGILVEQSPTDYLRFDVYFDDGPNILCAAISGNNYKILLDSPLPPTVTSPFYLRVFRIGYEYDISYSSDGVNYTKAGAVFQLQPFSSTRVGLFAGNELNNPPFTASLDYFLDTHLPVTLP